MKVSNELLKENNKEDGLDRWQLWESHRQTIKELQEKNIFSCNKNIDNAIVLGAGNCDDIDLKHLLSKVSKITLVDVNLEKMKSGVKNQNLSQEDYEKLEFIGNIDFTGLEDTNFYIELEKLLIKSEKPKQILKLITNSLKLIDEKALLIENEYSLVISGAIHSQLTRVAIELLNKFSENYSKKELKKIHKDLIYMDDIIALKYNDLIMSLAKDDAIIFSWFDLKEFSEELANYGDVGEIDKACKEGDSQKAIELVTENRYPGFHGYLDLNKRALEKDLKIKPWVNFWIWHYSAKKSYLVFSITINLKKER